MRGFILTCAVALAAATPTAAGAQGPPDISNLDQCNGLIVAYGDHPAGAPAFFAQSLGLPVAEALILARDSSACALQK